MNVEATFCFVDLAGFSALTEAHGDTAAADLVGRFIALVEGALADEGRLVKTIGDAVLVTTETPSAAVAFIEHLFGRASKERDFPVLRAGLHHGRAVERGGDVFGAAVNLTARIASHAGGDEVVATAGVAQAARAKGIETTARGRARLHNLREPVELFTLHVGPPQGGEVIDPVCRMRVARAEAPGRLRAENVDYWFCSLNCARLFAESPESYIPQR